MIKKNMKRVLAFGTYDLLHQGHKYHLKKASKYGQLCVVVARDSTVRKVKKKTPLHNEKERLLNVKKLDFVSEAVLGNKKDKYEIIKKIKPDIICLGYDQIHFVEGLREYLKENNLNAKIVKFRKSHFPEKYKTSIIAKTNN